MPSPIALAGSEAQHAQCGTTILECDLKEFGTIPRDSPLPSLKEMGFIL